MTAAVEVLGVSKQFRLYQEKYSTIKERVLHFGHAPYEEFWALTDIDLEIYQGETIGLLGHNGSGKSTLLKCIAGILQPTKGQIKTTGRLAALLELGAGFHPELSGRDNVFLNASLLGMSRKETAKRFDEIVAFAELEAFIDNQVKHYSSGMYVRLGFAVAVNMDPEVLLVDEVLTVGDEAFQRKCIDRVRQFQRDGRTIVVVTHAADLVRQLCDRGAVLDHGKLVALGDPGHAVRAFREHLMSGEDKRDEAEAEADEAAAPDAIAVVQEPERNFQVRIVSVDVDHVGSGERNYILPGESMILKLRYELSAPLDDVVFGVAVHDLEGRHLFGANSSLLDLKFDLVKPVGEVTFEFASVPLLDGDYLLTFGIHSRDEGTIYDWNEQKYRFSVMNPARTVGLVHVPVEIKLEELDDAQAINVDQPGPVPEVVEP